MNRRNFIGGIIAAGAAFSILPGAGRVWAPKRYVYFVEYHVLPSPLNTRKALLHIRATSPSIPGIGPEQKRYFIDVEYPIRQPLVHCAAADIAAHAREHGFNNHSLYETEVG